MATTTDTRRLLRRKIKVAWEEGLNDRVLRSIYRILDDDGFWEEEEVPEDDTADSDDSDSVLDILLGD